VPGAEYVLGEYRREIESVKARGINAVMGRSAADQDLGKEEECRKNKEFQD
jgi:hypothetical protein